MKTIEQSREDICNKWINSKNVIVVLQKYDIDPIFFQKHFGKKVLDHIVDILNSKSSINQSPIMYILTQFLNSKELGISDIYVICTELAFIFQEHFDDATSEKLLEILDAKLSTVEDYMDVTREAIQNDTLFILNTKTDKERLKDIRFTSANDISSTELFNLLNDYQINAIDDLQLNTYNLINLLDDMTTLESIQAYNRMPTFLEEFKQIETRLNDLMLFPIMSFSFKTLYEYLSVLSVNDFKNEEKKTLLVIMLAGLMEDLNKWVDTIFIQKIAEDAYYADASFANNCLEIELIFDDKHEEKNTNLQGQLMGEDELMEHFL